MAILVCAVVLAVSACSSSVVVGIVDDRAVDPAPVSQSKRPTVIVGGTGQALGASNPILGDIDGDGFDDFVIIGISPSSIASVPVQPISQVFLFYGRPEFPEQISTDDADATFDTNGFRVSPLRDVNGDGLADFAILHTLFQTQEIVLGSRTRFRGSYAPHSVGLVWESPPTAAAEVYPYTSLAMLAAAGDVNCDGIDDLLVTAAPALTDSSADTLSDPAGVVPAAHLVLGRPTLPTGLWHPSWAVASFTPTGPNGDLRGGALLPQSFGDLDADGCGDLAGTSGVDLFVYYGGPDRFVGRLGGHDADATLQAVTGYPVGIGDLDGDGAAEILSIGDSGGQFQITYGSRERWSGREQPLAPQLTLQFDSDAAPDGSFTIVDVGDISGDGAAELVIGSGMYGAQQADDETTSARGALYAMPGTGVRALGTRVLDDSNILLVGPAVEADTRSWPVLERPGLGTSLSVAGDVDGDGSRDIITGSPSASSSGSVFVIPSAPRAPD